MRADLHCKILKVLKDVDSQRKSINDALKEIEEIVDRYYEVVIARMNSMEW